MIKIKRSKRDANGNVIKPNDAWFEAANLATQDAISEQPNHDFKSITYAHQEVRRALEELFIGKCAYCESNFARFDWEVEHFRPKGNVAEREDHPGYYWLAYTWENLLPSCTRCNQHRKARPLWGGEAGISGGKLDQFPLLSERTRVMRHGNRVSSEERLLIDPCNDKPEAHLRYDILGDIFSNNGSRRGEASIRVFNLKEPRLRLARKEFTDMVIGILRIIEAIPAPHSEEQNNRIRDLISKLTSPSAEYSAVAKYILKNPQEFSILDDSVAAYR